MQSLLRKKYNTFFVSIGPNLASKTPQYDLTFKSYLPTVNTTLKETALSKDEPEEGFKPLKKKKKKKASDHNG